MHIGEALREARKMKRLTQSELERRSGLNREYVSLMENGHINPNISTLERMASALELPL
jgi:transcriptional regulator with XRE-family HTH domain